MNEDLKEFNIMEIVIKTVIILVTIGLLLWLIPRPNMEPVYDRLFIDNIETMKDVAKSYFTISRLPKNKDDTVKMSLDEMIDKKLILPIIDSNNNICDKNKSHVEIYQTEDEYLIKVYLVCSTNTDYIIQSLGCYNLCKDEIEQETKEVKETNKQSSEIVKKPVIVSKFKKHSIQLPVSNDEEIVYEYEYKRPLYKGYKLINIEDKLYEQVKYSKKFKGYEYTCPFGYLKEGLNCYKKQTIIKSNNYDNFPYKIEYDKNGEVGILYKSEDSIKILNNYKYIPEDIKYIEKVYKVVHSTIVEWDGQKWDFVIEGSSVPSTQFYNNDEYTGKLKPQGSFISTVWGELPSIPGNYMGEYKEIINYSDLLYVGYVTRPSKYIEEWKYNQYYTGIIKTPVTLIPQYEKVIINCKWTTEKKLENWESTGETITKVISEKKVYTDWVSKLPSGYIKEAEKIQYKWTTKSSLIGWIPTGELRIKK